MNVVAAVALFGFIMVLTPLCIRMAIAAGRVGRGGLGGWIGLSIVLGIVPALLCGGAYWVSRRGFPQEGVVTGKSDTLEISDLGLAPSVNHRLVLSIATDHAVESASSANPRTAFFERLRRPRANLEFDVDERLYDAVRQDEIMHLHSVRWGPLIFARLDAEPWWNIAPGRLERLLPLHARGPLRTAQARITGVRTVRDAYETSLLAAGGEGGAHVSLKQPYEEVRLSFSTKQGADIIALDRIDAGSAGALTPDAWVAVRYPQDHPRTAQLTRGHRSFASINAWDYWGTEVLGFLAAASLTGLAVWGWRRARARHGSNAL